MSVFCRCLFFLIAAGCSQPEENDIEAVQRVARGIIAADNQGDPARVINFYHPQAILSPPGKPAVIGLQAIRANYENIFSSTELHLEIEIQETRAEEHWAVVVGKNGGYRINKLDQSRTEIDDPFMMILEKWQGEWKIKRLLWN